MKFVLLSFFAFFPAVVTVYASESEAQKIFREYQEAALEIPAESITALAAEFEGKLAVGNQTLASGQRKVALREIENGAVKKPIVQELASLLTANAQSEVEKILFIHNFVLWRITHLAYFSPGYSTEESLTSTKGRLLDCLKKHQYDNGIYYRIEKCGLSRAAEKKEWLQQILYTGLHNCMGYSYLFLSLARAAGIPTIVALEPRAEVRGGHYWNLVFVKGQWLVVDTTFDDVYDVGAYEKESPMKLDFTYFLVTAEKAAELDPDHHKKFKLRQ